MARKDRSFTGTDIVRLTVKNLTTDEQIFVIQELCQGIRELENEELPGIQDVEIEELIVDLIFIARGLFRLGLSIGNIIRVIVGQL